MDRSIIYVFEDGWWMYGADYNPYDHEYLGKYQEFIIGRGFQEYEIDEMVRQYLYDLWNDEDD